jgi:hypothetical protein
VAVLDLYEGMTHVFQPRMADAPEGEAAMQKMAAFLNQHLERGASARGGNPPERVGEAGVSK